MQCDKPLFFIIQGSRYQVSITTRFSSLWQHVNRTLVCRARLGPEVTSRAQTSRSRSAASVNLLLPVLPLPAAFPHPAGIRSTMVPLPVCHYVKRNLSSNTHLKFVNSSLFVMEKHNFILS